MKIKLLIVLSLVFMSVITYGLDLKVITYNIRVDKNEEDSLSWKNRKVDVIDLMQFYEADIFCLQEALLNQVNDIAAYMAGYDWVGVGKNNGITQGEYSPIFYNSQKYQLKEQGWFWLSDTHDSPSMGWDATTYSICTYALLEDYDSHDQFWVFNTKLDEDGTEARKESVRLINEKIQKLTKRRDPVILAGDFNANPEEEPVAIVLEKLDDSRERSVLTPYGPEGTFNNFDTSSEHESRIDYIFINKNVVVNKYAVISDSKNRRYPSDHFPVYCEISF